MKYMIRKISMLATMLLMVSAFGCRGYVDPATLRNDVDEPNQPLPGPGPEQPKDPVIPVGELYLTADKTTISANGSDLVTFKVLFGTEEGNKDVSTAKTMYLIRTLEGVEEQMASAANAFSTTKAGNYTFKARYYNNGEVFSNEVAVEVTPASSTGVNYFHKLFGMQFTSVGCQNCPELSNVLAQIREEQPDQMVVASYHMDFNYSDPMRHSITQTLLNYFGAQGLPQFFINLRKETQTGAFKAPILRAMEQELQNFPPTCGVAIESSIAENTLTVRAKFTSTISSAYRYDIILVEDNIEEFQLGSTGLTYFHNNVVRHVDSGNTFGARLNSGQPLEAGAEFVQERSIKLNNDWNYDNMRIIVLANSSTDGGSSWTVNNCNECKMGESIDYLYDGEAPTPGDDPTPGPTPGEEQEFVLHHTIMELTGAWCSQCPSGLTTLNFLITQNKGEETMHIIALHDSTGGGDPMATPLTNTIFSDFNLTGYPSFIINLELGGTLTSEWGDLRTYLFDTRQKTAECGIALKTTYNESSRTGTVEVKIKSNSDKGYRVALYLLEDGIVYAQKNGSSVHEDYVHNHVMRQLLSSTYKGDRLGDATTSQELTKSYDYTISSDYVAENCTICAMAIDNQTGLVLNTAVCSATGEQTDYDLK